MQGIDFSFVAVGSVFRSLMLLRFQSCLRWINGFCGHSARGSRQTRRGHPPASKLSGSVCAPQHPPEVLRGLPTLPVVSVRDEATNIVPPLCRGDVITAVRGDTATALERAHCKRSSRVLKGTA